MDLKREVARAAQSLAVRIGACVIIVIAGEVAEIRELLDTRIPVVIARIDSDAAVGEIHTFSRVPAGIDQASQFLKVSRIELMSEALEAAYMKGLITGRIVVGIVSIGDVHSIVVIDITDIPFIEKIADLAAMVDYSILKAVLNLAIEIGREGREGKKIGTAFVVGDTDRVLDVSHQLILNPYAGHPAEARDVKNEDNWETVKEFAQLDGMFIVDAEGFIVAAGRYLDVNAREVALLSGVGGRHLAAAAITRCARCVAVTVSESGGMVTVYKGGKQVFQINPRLSFT